MSALLLDEFVARAYEPTAQTRRGRLMQARRYRPLNEPCDGFTVGRCRATWRRPIPPWRQRVARARRAAATRAELLQHFEEACRCAA